MFDNIPSQEAISFMLKMMNYYGFNSMDTQYNVPHVVFGDPDNKNHVIPNKNMYSSNFSPIAYEDTSVDCGLLLSVLKFNKGIQFILL